MGAGVERVPRRGVGEAVVGGDVDDQHVGPELFRDGGAVAVGQGEHDHVVPVEGPGGGGLQLDLGERR